MTAADVWARIDRQREAGDYEDPAFEAWQELQADLAEQAAADYWAERELERADS